VFWTLLRSGVRRAGRCAHGGVAPAHAARHKRAITALHAGTRSELGDIAGEAEDVGYFVSGCVDGTLKLWDPAMRGNEFQATMTRALRVRRGCTRRWVGVGVAMEP